MSPAQLDPTLHLAEKNWWNLWNTSYRSKDDNDETSTQLFGHVAGIIRDLSRLRTKRILEVACGTGILSRQLEFSSYHGLDVSPAAIEIASAKAGQLSLPEGTERPAYEVADVHDWPLPRHLFDVIICVDAVAYFHDQQFALNKMVEALTPSGQLVLTTINPLVYKRIRPTAWASLKEGSISHWLSRGELHGLIASAGLRIERSYTIMPRGNMGFLRIVNSAILNEALGNRSRNVMRRCKEWIGLGQYRVVVATRERIRSQGNEQ